MALEALVRLHICVCVVVSAIRADTVDALLTGENVPFEMLVSRERVSAVGTEYWHGWASLQVSSWVLSQW